MTAAAARELAGFIARYDRPVAALARAALVRLRRRLPGATELGSGSRVRSVRLHAAAKLDSPELVALIRAAIARAKTPLDPGARRRLVIRSVSARQRPRARA